DPCRLQDRNLPAHLSNIGVAERLQSTPELRTPATKHIMRMKIERNHPRFEPIFAVFGISSFFGSRADGVLENKDQMVGGSPAGKHDVRIGAYGVFQPLLQSSDNLGIGD